MPQPDRDLVEACCRGDAAAWRELVDRFAPLCCHILRRTLLQRGWRAAEAEVDDLSAELFAELVASDYRRLRMYDPTYALTTYLGLIARSRAIDYWRRKVVEPRRSDADPTEIAAAPPHDTAPALDPGGELVQKLQAALEGLSPKERMMVQMFYFGGKKYREIAEAMGVPINTVCSTLCRTLEKLRKRLGDGESERLSV